MLGVLDYLLVFLLSHVPQTGYAIRQQFQATPVGRFSDSPGAIYPALSRLEKRGWITSSAERDGRRKREYTATAAGKKALLQWLRSPVCPVTIERRPDELTLRYVMTAEFGTSDDTRSFLRNCIAGFQAHLDDLNKYVASPHGLPEPGLEAVLHGISLCRAYLNWHKKLLERWEQKQ